MRWELTLPGNPAPKKNSGRVVFYGQKCRGCNRGKFPRILPAEPWERWKRELMRTHKLWKQPQPFWTICQPVNCRATFYRGDARAVDAVNLYEGLADVLEEAGVIDNDRRIVSWNESRVYVDRENPRVEVVLESVEA